MTISQVLSIVLPAGLGLALGESGWTMSTVRALNHASHPVQTLELGHTTVIILRMWLFTVVRLYCVCDSYHLVEL